MKYYIILIIIASTQVFGQNFEHHKIPTDKDFYQFRMNILQDSNYNAYEQYPERQDIFSFYPSDIEKFIEKAEDWISQYPFDMNILYTLTFAYLQQGEYSKYAEKYFQYLGLVSSILTSGDGKSCETAFEIISTSEEYTIINELRLQFKSQGLAGNCDIMTCEDRDGNTVKLYFNVTNLFKNMRKTLNPQDTTIKN